MKAQARVCVCVSMCLHLNLKKVSASLCSCKICRIWKKSIRGTWRKFSKDEVRTDWCVSLWLRSPPHQCTQLTQRQTCLHSLVPVWCVRLFEMVYVCRTRQLCLPESHFCAHKDKGRGIITYKHKRVWWHLCAIPGHLNSDLCLSLDTDPLVMPIIWNSLVITLKENFSSCTLLRHAGKLGIFGAAQSKCSDFNVCVN